MTGRAGGAAVVLAVLGVLFFPIASASPDTGDPNLRAALAYVQHQCGRSGVPATTMWIQAFPFNALFGNCHAGDGRDQHIWFFVRGRFVGTDGAGSSRSILGMWRDDRRIAFMYVLYRGGDPACCPTGGGALVRFRWNGSRVVPLDARPPCVSARVRLGRC
jgi:hypothetical protein